MPKIGQKESILKDNIYTPKFRIDEKNILNTNIEINKQYKYNQNLIVDAVKNGMIMTILYRGEEDKWRGGRERTICPLVLGTNKNTKNTLIRGWHLDGYSVHLKSNVEKVWRLFNVENIKSITFTGDYLRMPPKNYKMNDRTMTERTIVRANFNEIRNNQNRLIKSGQIESEEESQVNDKLSIAKINVENLDKTLDLVNPFNNDILSNYSKNPGSVKISILKKGNNLVCLVGAIGTINRSVVLYDGNNKLGTYKTIETFTGDKFNNYKRILGKTQMPIYNFLGKK
jgi:hypothetical protein